MTHGPHSTPSESIGYNPTAPLTTTQHHDVILGTHPMNGGYLSRRRTTPTSHGVFLGQSPDANATTITAGQCYLGESECTAARRFSKSIRIRLPGVWHLQPIELFNIFHERCSQKIRGWWRHSAAGVQQIFFLEKIIDHPYLFSSPLFSFGFIDTNPVLRKHLQLHLTGRPWNDLATTVYLRTYMDASIRPAGWTPFNSAR